MSSELIQKSKVALADTYAFSIKVQGYHWNVVGPDFPQLHKFFGKLYEEVSGSIDDLAEHIRQLDAFAPGSLLKMAELATLEDEEGVPVPAKMVSNLYDDNEKMLQTMTELYELAEEEKMFGFSNFLQDRITAHSKHRWMLKSTSLRK